MQTPPTSRLVPQPAYPLNTSKSAWSLDGEFQFRAHLLARPFAPRRALLTLSQLIHDLLKHLGWIVLTPLASKIPLASLNLLFPFVDAIEERSNQRVRSVAEGCR